MRSLVTVLLLLIFSVTVANAQPKDKPAVRFENVSQDLQDQLRRKYSFLQESSVDMEQLDRAMKTLHKISDFEMVNVLQDENGYVLKIVPSDQLKILTITNLEEVSQSDAENLFGWSKGQILSESQVQDGVEKLKGLYRSRGYLKPQVTYKITRNEKQKLQAIVSVQKGDPTIISSITVQSNNEELNQQLTRILKYQRKPILSEEEIQSIQEKIKDELNDGKYLLAQVRGPQISYNKTEDHADLVYQIENPIQYAFDFKGAQYFSQSKLMKILDLEHYLSTSQTVGTDLGLRIKTAYIARGYARVDVDEKYQIDRPNYKRILFDIKEGPRVTIEKWVFSGRLTRDQKYYAELIRDSASDVIKDNYFVKEDLDSAIANLRVALQNEGFLTAKVISTRYQYNREKDRMTVFVNLDEGPLTQVAKVLFEGNHAFSSEQLHEQIEMSEGKPLFLNLISESVSKIKTYYQERGYLEVSVLNEKTDLVTYNEDNTQATVKFTIKEGPKVKVASIIFEGNTFTEDQVIRAELEFHEGDTLTPSEIDDSVLRLERTGYFNSVEIKTLEENTAVEQRTVIVRITERDPGLFTMGAGATNEHTLTMRGYVGVGYNNLLGTGRGISLRVQGNYNPTDFKYFENQETFGYLEPHLFNTKNRGLINITRSKLITDDVRVIVTEANISTYTIARDITRHLSMAWDVWSLETDIQYGLRQHPDHPELDIARTETQIASTAVTFELDYRNNVFNPTKGNFTHVNFEYSEPSFGGSETINYWRTVDSFSYYAPFWKNWNWAQLYKAGYVRNVSTQPDAGVPYDKKGFTLGGESTIRGFQPGTLEAFPNANQLNLSDKAPTYYLTTEARMFMWKSEVRFPIYGNFGGAVFYDGGYVQIEGLQFDDYYRDAAGFGLRYNTPVGPFNMEIGKKLDRKAGEDPWVFHLSIGAF